MKIKLSPLMFKKFYVIEFTFNTDPDGNWVDYNDWSNQCIFGPFKTVAEAEYYEAMYPEDDTDLKEVIIRIATLKDKVRFINDPEILRRQAS